MVLSIKKEIFQSKKYIVYTYVLSFFTMLPLFIAAPPLSESKRLILLVALFVFLIFLAKFSKYVWAMFIIYLNFASLAIFHTFVHWGYDGNLRWAVMLESPERETVEYFQTHLDWRDGLLVFYVLLILYFLYKIIKHYKHSFKILKYFGLLLSISIIFMLSLVQNPFKIEPLGIPWEYIKAKEYLIYPKKRIEKLSMLFDKKPLAYHGEYDKIIIIQGESASRHHMSVYGYDVKTTPFFDSLKEKTDHFFIFDAIAPANQTRLSVPLINTPATVHNFLKAYMGNLSLIGNFRRHGFKTYCISGQRAYGMTNITIGSMCQEADETFFADLEGKRVTDLMLVDYMKKNRDFQRKEMYFFHLIGSHFDYNKRYTKKIRLIKNPHNTLEEYDNTIFFTDYVIKQIYDFFIKKFPDQNILLVYTSDHGEMVGKQEAGHGYVPPFKEEYDVPFIIYSSSTNPRLQEITEMNKKGLINLESLFEIVEYVAGLKDTLKVSYSKDVNCLEPENIYNYDELSYSKYIEIKEF